MQTTRAEMASGLLVSAHTRPLLQVYTWMITTQHGGQPEPPPLDDGKEFKYEGGLAC
jgi:hypothetical protein